MQRFCRFDRGVGLFGGVGQGGRLFLLRLTFGLERNNEGFVIFCIMHRHSKNGARDSLAWNSDEIVGGGVLSVL